MSDLWQYSTTHNSVCKVIEEQTLWGQAVCRIWLPQSDTVVKIPSSALISINDETNLKTEKDRITYIATAAKVAEILEGSTHANQDHILLAPMESNVIPLPHQITALSRAISGDKIRYLLADEVGLGKTIEAGMILRELKIRGLVKRILIVAPKSIAPQWISEMQIHFNEEFKLILGEDLKTLSKLSSNTNTNPWGMFNQVVVSLDSVKPLEKRKGWSQKKIAEYNKTRFEDLITANWDLVIVDESHRLGGSTDRVARYKLGQGLADAAPYLLLLSATPHQGKTDAFHRLMTLIDSEAFPDVESVSKERVSPYVIRTEKRKSIDANGNPLFKPRRTETVSVAWQEHHKLQQNLYDLVTEYVREGYNQALKDKKQHVGFLMILMQRLVVSSTRAIRTTLERRILALENQKQNNLLKNSENIELEFENIYDLDGQELLDELLETNVTAIENEVTQVKFLLDIAIQSEHAGFDAKAEQLIDRIYQLQSDENETDLKILIFTEFIPTQMMLKDFLTDRGFSVAFLNGSLSMEERMQAQNTFKKDTRILISTDAGGEGLNLQFCHIVFNYDIPWNPMRLEQRIGRVDRIGQSKTVRAINFILEDSVEFRVREVLEEKLSIIFEEFGIDKTGDVLDSAQAGEIYDKMFTTAILSPTNIEEATSETARILKDEINENHKDSTIYGISNKPDPQATEYLRSHPLPYWLERMTISYLKSHNGKAVREKDWWNLVWPTGNKNNKVSFTAHEVEFFDANIINLENSDVREIAANISAINSNQLIPSVYIKSIPESITGYWGLFEINILPCHNSKNSFFTKSLQQKRFLSVFTNENGKSFLPTARHIWEKIHEAEISILEMLSVQDSKDAFDWLTVVAEEAGQNIFNELRQEHLNYLEKETERVNYSHKIRSKLNNQLGLAEVRKYRNNKLKQNKLKRDKELQAAKQTIPEIKPLLILKIIKGIENE